MSDIAIILGIIQVALCWGWYSWQPFSAGLTPVLSFVIDGGVAWIPTPRLTLIGTRPYCWHLYSWKHYYYDLIQLRTNLPVLLLLVPESIVHCLGGIDICYAPRNDSYSLLAPSCCRG